MRIKYNLLRSLELLEASVVFKPKKGKPHGDRSRDLTPKEIQDIKQESGSGRTLQSAVAGRSAKRIKEYCEKLHMFAGDLVSKEEKDILLRLMRNTMMRVDQVQQLGSTTVVCRGLPFADDVIYRMRGLDEIMDEQEGRGIDNFVPRGVQKYYLSRIGCTVHKEEIDDFLVFMKEFRSATSEQILDVGQNFVEALIDQWTTTLLTPDDFEKIDESDVIPAHGDGELVSFSVDELGAPQAKTIRYSAKVVYQENLQIEGHILKKVQADSDKSRSAMTSETWLSKVRTAQRPKRPQSAPNRYPCKVQLHTHHGFHSYDPEVL